MREKFSSRFPTRFDTNKAVQPQKMARGLKSRTYEVERLFDVADKGADQLRSSSAALFRICKKQVVS